MSRLIVLSNRVKMPDGNPMAGGLAVALHEILTQNSSIWMGWNGAIVDTDSDGDSNEFSHHKVNDKDQSSLASHHRCHTSQKITYITTSLTTKQHQHYYCGFANNVLWPLLHEQTDLIAQAFDDYAGYQAVNLLFAKQLQKTAQPDDVIWVHDYHFMSVAYHCRRLGMRNRIGFFLHIPFVPLRFWQSLDKSDALIKHLAHYDVLGTQTQQDKANCLTVLQYYLKDLVADTTAIKQNIIKANDSDKVSLTLNLNLCANHCLTINAYPIGVNVAKIQQHIAHLSSQAAEHSHNQNTTKLSAQQIIAVDRIDYSKGLIPRFLAYRDFLQHYPKYQNQLKLLQIACPSRLDLKVYQRLYNEVKQTVAKVNQQFLNCTCSAIIVQAGNDKICHCENKNFRDNGVKPAELVTHWQAIRYSESVIGHDTLMKLFWQSDIGWVNSLKDGMNLVAKEYIAAQNPANPGVLLLSRYAGAAEQMQAALIIDPHQPSSVIQSLNTALTMPLAERQERHQTLLLGLQQDDLQVWQQSFLEELYSK